jgi:hypothetical protein
MTELSSLYPACRYAPNGRQCVVQDADEDRALGSGWFDHPDKAVAGASAPEVPESDIDQAEAEAVYATSVKELVARIKAMESLEALAKVAEIESNNPSGARKGVVKAVSDRVADLTPAPVATE